MDTHSTRWHSILTNCTRRIQFGCICIVACALAPLLALWQANDPHPQMEAMFLAARVGNVAAMDRLLGGGLDVDCCYDTGGTPLMAAARAGKLDSVRKLLATGARINISTPVIGTPLMLATAYCRHDVMRELIECGADVNAVNSAGQTALWYARVIGDDETVRILTTAGAVAEGESTSHSEGELIAAGADVRSPSETRAIKTAHSAVPAIGAESGKPDTFVQ